MTRKEGVEKKPARRYPNNTVKNSKRTSWRQHRTAQVKSQKSHASSWIICCRKQEIQPLNDRNRHPGRATKGQIEPGNQQHRDEPRN
jgi:hypothetical protein